MSSTPYPKHPFNKVVNTIIDTLEIEGVTSRVVLVTGNLAKYNYVELVSENPKLAEAVKEILITMLKSFNGNNDVAKNHDPETGRPRVEIDKHCQNIGENLIALAEEVRARDAFPSFKEAFHKLGSLATDQTYRAQTGRTLLIMPVIKEDSHGLTYGFNVHTNDLRVANAARQLSGLGIEPIANGYVISSHNGANNQMSELFDKIREFGAQRSESEKFQGLRGYKS